LVQGYTVNQTRLAERGLLEARQTLDLLARTLQNQALVDDTGRAVLDLIVGYAATWRLLLEYDEGRLALPSGVMPSSGVLDFARASAAIDDFKRELIARKAATPLFGNPRGQALEGILGSIEQTMFGESLYRSREEKAAHVLYLVIKDRRKRPRQQGLDDPADHQPADGARCMSSNIALPALSEPRLVKSQTSRTPWGAADGVSTAREPTLSPSTPTPSVSTRFTESTWSSGSAAGVGATPSSIGVCDNWSCRLVTSIAGAACAPEDPDLSASVRPAQS